MTVVGSNAGYRTLRASDLTRVPAAVDAAEAAALILSWTTAYQLLHRTAHVQRGQRVLVQGAAGALGQALLVLGRMAGLEMWGTGRSAQATLIREFGATPIDYQREDFTRVLPGGFDFVFDGVGEDGYRRSFAALKPGGLLCAYGYSAGVQAQRRLLATLAWIARVYLWRRLLSWLPGGKRVKLFSINLMRARRPAGSKKISSACLTCWRPVPSAHASQNGFHSMRSPRHIGVSKQVVSMAGSFCAQTSSSCSAVLLDRAAVIMSALAAKADTRRAIRSTHQHDRATDLEFGGQALSRS